MPQRTRFSEQHLIARGATAAERYSNLAVQYYLEGRSQRALKYLQSALHRDTSLKEARFNLALFYEEEGRPREAAREWGRYIHLDPEGPHASFARQRLRRVREQ